MHDVLANFRFRIAGCGASLPTEVLTNRALAGELGVEEQWILDRCGIETRHQSTGEETT
jgi:3-oxoacyl-[acyl-carrier-protein] synthase-3